MNAKVDDYLKFIRGGAEENFTRDGHLYTAFFLFLGSDLVIPLILPTETNMQKTVTRNTLVKCASDRAVVAIGCVCEVFSVDHPESAKTAVAAVARAKRTIAPGMHPDRIERVLVTVEMRDGTFYRDSARILREPGERPQLDDWEGAIYSPVSSGLFCNLFTRAMGSEAN